MKDFLKYVMVFILITMAIWSNDRPKDYPITYTNQIEREMAYVKKSIKEVNGVFKIFKNAPNFVKNLPVE